MAEVKEIKKAQEVAAPRDAGNRSAIASPYFDLMASVGVAHVAYNELGGTCSPDQLAAALKYKSTASGTYLTRIASANKHFGLITVTGDRISVTERAKKILAPVMPEDAADAKVEAFLAVPLFVRIYEQFKGSQLPPDVGLKNLFLNSYAILPDRVPQALRVFLSSAEQAGFFIATPDRSRLIRPSIVLQPAAATATTPPAVKVVETPPREEQTPRVNPAERRSGGSGGGSDGTGGVHSAIIGLLRDLPPPGADWPKKQKARFIKAFQATLDFVYPSDDEDDPGGAGK